MNLLSSLQGRLFAKKHKEGLHRWEGIWLYKRVVDDFVFECFHGAVDLQFHSHQQDIDAFRVTECNVAGRAPQTKLLN